MRLATLHSTLLIMLLLPLAMQAQVKFNGQLLNKADATPLPYAYLRLADMDKYTVTDSTGKFSFTLPDTLKTLHLEVSDIGLHTTITYTLTGTKLEKVLVAREAHKLKGVEIKGYTAKQVVEKAISQIPVLYAGTSYFAHSFYRQYHKENGKFVKLIELQAVTMFRLTKGKKEITSKEAYSPKAFRRSVDYEVNRLQHLDHFFDLLQENPIYHAVGTVLNYRSLNDFVFSMDTTKANDSTYAVHYESKNYNEESLVSGTLYIDRYLFAIRKAERVNTKNTNNDYRQVLSPEYISDFESGSLSVEYEPIDGVWYMTKLLREYTSNIYYRMSGNRMSHITECFEWYADSITDRVSATLGDNFAETSNLYGCKYEYKPDDWAVPQRPFVYFKQEEVYNSLDKRRPINEQFKVAGQ